VKQVASTAYLNGLPGVASQKIKLFITTAGRTSNPATRD
jgi:hypothetical protein